jgi:hypothetical protein
MERSFSLGGSLHDAEAARVEAEIREELEAHVQLCVEALLAQGRTPEEAQREARARFGDFEQTLRACRRVRLGGRIAMQRLQWILIFVLGASTVLLGLHGRAQGANAAAERDRAHAQAAAAMEAIAELRASEAAAREPVESIVIGVGDDLRVKNDVYGNIEQNTQVQLDGQALFREVGWVAVAGRTRQQVEQELTTRYAALYQSAGPVYVLVKSAR